MFFVDDENLVSRRNKLVEQLENIEQELYIDDVSYCGYLNESEKINLKNRKSLILNEISEIDSRIEEKKKFWNYLDEIV
jgi:hypothetical protein